MKHRVNTNKAEVTRALQNMREEGTIDVDYGELSADTIFRKKGSLQLKVKSIQATDTSRKLTCVDQQNRQVVISYYPRYKTAYVEIPD